jgi:hypothetical protein
LDPGLAGIAGAVLGGGMVVGGAWLQRRWSTKDVRTQRVEERADDAARRILDVLEELRTICDGQVTFDTTDIGNQGLYELSRRIDRDAILIPNKDFRDRIGMFSTTIWHLDVVAYATRNPIQQVSVLLYRAGEEVIGSYLRVEALPDLDATESLKRLAIYHREAEETEAQIERELAAFEEDDSHNKDPD